MLSDARAAVRSLSAVRFVWCPVPRVGGHYSRLRLCCLYVASVLPFGTLLMTAFAMLATLDIPIPVFQCLTGRAPTVPSVLAWV
jgi:hypothetical protein